ncbi:MAG: hypothetical protein A2Y80_01995 [Deltaproteobacteria bacterium RBG_13_58_19]|nr:MAG: hypothetical protein A2Y80_01995 [Deltaproteobacteria bacterium RBG_13_58_19]
MGSLKSKMVILAVMLVLGIAGATASYGAQPKLSRVLYLTLSQACGCILDRCKAGDWVVDKVFVGERQGLLKRIDYSTDKETARQYIKKYRITLPPALIFLDAQGGELWRAMGDVDYDLVLEKLKQFGA